MTRSRRPALLLLWLSVLLTLGALPAVAQESDPEPVAEISITDVGIARYPAMTMVVDVGNVETFDAADLSVLEDGEPIQDAVATPIAQNPVPVGIVLAIDTSQATSGATLEAAKEAAVAFIDNMRAQDLVAIVGFGEEVEVFTGFTSNNTALRFAVSQLEASGPSRLYDSVVRAADLYSAVGGDATLETNLIILAGGPDTGSEASLTDAIAAVEGESLSVYAVGLGPDGFDSAGIETLAGDNYVATVDPGQLQSLYGDIQRALDNRVVLSFTAGQDAPRDVTFEVRYQAAVASEVVTVPGFIINPRSTTTLPPTYSVAAPPVAEAASPSPATLRLLSILTMAAAIALFVVIIGFGRGTDVVSRRLSSLQGRRFVRPGTEIDGEEESFLKRIPFLSRFASQAEDMAASQGLLQPIANMLEQANILWRPGEVVAGALGVALVASVIVALLQGSLIVGVGAFVILVLVIAVGLRFVASREKSRFVDQMPGTLGLIATSLRSGQSFLQALEAVASEAPEPTSREYQRAVAETRLGRPIGGAMRAIADRMDSEDFGWVVMATDIQREVGGNLAEVLDIVADTMLQRNRLRREVKALSAEGRISAMVLGGLPVFLFLFLYTSNRSYLEPLVDRTAGWIMIGVAITSMLAAFAWLRKIVNIEV
ncbi:MAG: type II secretion system F family protein [Acidimicrobiia bacterium]|nr:type II secretion system F family protein [Acidimicrobiia bacterium]